MNYFGTSLWIFAIGLACSAFLAGPSRAQTPPPPPVVFTCIGKDTSSDCSGGDTSLRHFSGASGSPYKYLSVSGYYAASDGGGGDFYLLGSATSKCASASGTGTFTQGSYTVTVNFLTSPLSVGEIIISPSVPTGAEIAGINGSSITMTLPATAGGAASISIAGDNGGTLIIDNETTHQCYQKTNYRGDPHEWGAYGDDSHPDDTTLALQNWLGAPGPWLATIPATYETNKSLFCWGTHIQAGGAGGGGAVTIQASTSGSPSWLDNALLVLETACEVSGLSVDANNVINISTGTALDSTYIDTGATRPLIDGHSKIANGRYNLYCPGGSGGDGLRISDTIFSASTLNNIELDHCSNVKMSNDLVTNSGLAGIVFEDYSDFNLWNSTIQQSNGPGLKLVNIGGTPDLGSITGNFFDNNGENTTTGGAGIEIDGAAHISICGNHFNRNDNGSGPNTAHIRFGGGTNPNSAVVFCGNEYRQATQSQCTGTCAIVPAYVYDVGIAGSSAVNGTSFYENPQAQHVGVFSPTAAPVLAQLQALPGFARNYLTGFIMVNGGAGTLMTINSGQAADSTNTVLLSLPSGCTVDLSMSGLGGLDLSTIAANTTYYFFVIAQAAGANPGCVASKQPIPTLGSGTLANYSLYRAVGIMFTQPSSAALEAFTQDDDTFYLNTSGSFSATVGTTSTQVTINSVPGIQSVKMFGRCAATHNTMLSAGGTPAQAPSSSTFSTSPGYAVNAANPITSFPFSLYTQTNGTSTVPTGWINAAASSSGTLLQCYNDGWVWHRGR